MDRIQAPDLHKHVGRCLRFFDMSDNEMRTRVGRIVVVDVAQNQVTLRSLTDVLNKDEGRDIVAFYDRSHEVEVCDDEEAVLLALKGRSDDSRGGED